MIVCGDPRRKRVKDLMFKTGYVSAIDDFVSIFRQRTRMENGLVDEIAEEMKRRVEEVIVLLQNEDGKFEEFKLYAEIACKTKEEFNQLQSIIEQHKGWRDINKELPEPGAYVLVSFENDGLTFPDIAVYEVDQEGNGAFCSSDGNVPYASLGIFVNAWMPLPKLYKREEASDD